MTRRRALVLAGVVLAVAAAAMSAWAANRYAQIDATRSFYYALNGYSAAAAAIKGAQDAAAATGWMSVAAWVLVGGALLSLILAIAARPEKPAGEPHPWPVAERSADES